MSRAPDTRLSEELMRLNRTQRQQLVNVVSKRFLREAAGENTPTTGVAAADPPAEPTRYSVPEAPVGEVIKDARGTAAFEKTDAGWKSTIKVPLERILMLVKETNRQVVGKLLQDAGEGEVITILTGFLADAEDANMDKGLRVKKVDGMFMDPVTVPDDKITVIADALKYKAPEIKSGTPKTPAKVVLGPDDRVFNNIIFKDTDDTLKVIVDLDKGGTAQLKRLLGTDEAVTKADEQIANAPTSGESKITLRYDDGQHPAAGCPQEDAHQHPAAGCPQEAVQICGRHGGRLADRPAVQVPPRQEAPRPRPDWHRAGAVGRDRTAA
jgi:hypothetical protein